MNTVRRPRLCAGTGNGTAGVVLLLLTIMGMGLLPSVSVAEPAQEGQRDRARNILDEGGYQPISSGDQFRDSASSGTARGGSGGQERGKEEGREKASTSSDVETEEGWQDSSDRNPLNLPDIPFLSEIIQVMMWVGVAVLVGVLLLIIVQLVRLRLEADTGLSGAGGAEANEEERNVLDRSGMHETLEDADALAEQGRFTEAIRCMFLDTARRIERDLGVSLQKSDTNHEFLDRFPSSDVRRLCLVLVRAVDRFYYGGKTCEESDYRHCREVWKKVQSREAPHHAS